MNSMDFSQLSGNESKKEKKKKFKNNVIIAVDIIGIFFLATREDNYNIFNRKTVKNAARESKEV